MNNPALRSSSLFYRFGQALEPIWTFVTIATNQTTITQSSSLQPNDYIHYTTPIPMSLWVHMHNSNNH